MAAYYPVGMPAGQDHDLLVLVDRLRGVELWPMHCDRDKLCRLDLPHVGRLYALLKEANGVEVAWISAGTAKGTQSNYHSAHRRVFENPDLFFQELLQHRRADMTDAVAYLRQRLQCGLG